MVRVLACHARCHGFESRHSRQFNCPVAQLVEHSFDKAAVAGSNPAGTTIFNIAPVAQLEEPLFCKQ